MKKVVVLAIASGLASLAACNSSPQEQAADNIEENAESAAENLEAAADNAGTPAQADALENQAEATRNAGEMKAEDLTHNDADTNLANGL